jgi:hypothetical protein
MEFVGQETGARHIGPMAQASRSAVGLGEDDEHISTADEEGVSLAAIRAAQRRTHEYAVLEQGSSTSSPSSLVERRTHEMRAGRATSRGP